ncbi:hypothetical protein, partial [Luedemannella flava]|uniref:hypothetical protein n=1 Tax=Luedemannella flava TaxID=349316 RepID=UPI0031D41FDF
VHEARGVGLHRAAAAGVRVVESLRAARSDAASFRLAELTDDLRELLTVCHQLRAGLGDVAAALGTARREYDDLGSLRLSGLFAEPVLTTSGYAGASTYLCDDERRLWTLSSVRPGGIAEARGGANAAVTLGEVRLSHRDAGRAGVVVVGAKASASGRLSGSVKVRAVRAAGRLWTDEPLAGLWREPLAAQLARYDAALVQPAQVRPAGRDLLFLRGVLDVGPQGLTIVTADAATVAVEAAFADPALPTVQNLRQLARAAVGHEALLIGRIAGTRTVHGLALSADWLPERLGGHVDLSVDALDRSDLPGQADFEAPEAAPVATVVAPPALHLLRLRVERAVSGGRAAVRTPSATDAARLSVAQLSAGAAVLTALHEAAAGRTRDVLGRLDPLDEFHLARAWLAAAVYDDAVGRHLAVAGWLRP